MQTLLDESVGIFAAGPTKRIERCHAKVQNDYQSETYPTAAHLLDIVRCSFTFQNLQGLLQGYEYLNKQVLSMFFAVFVGLLGVFCNAKNKKRKTEKRKKRKQKKTHVFVCNTH